VGWASGETLILMGTAVVMIASFFAIERREQGAAGPAPRHLPHPHDHERERRRAADRHVAVLDVLLVSLYMQQVLGYDALKTGVSYLPLGGRDHRRGGDGVGPRHAGTGFKPILVLGMVLTAAAWCGSRRSPRAAPT